MSVRRTVAALLGAALLLAGCSDDPEPRFQPTNSPSPSESATSADPEAQTPEEFIREWFELNTEMQNSGETEAFLAVSRNCKPCRGLASRVAGIYQAGGSVRLDRQDVTAVKPVSSAASLEQFDVTIKASPTLVRETRGSEIQRMPGGPNVYRVTLVQNETLWTMQNLLDVN